MIPHVLSGLHFVEKFFSYTVVDSTNELARNIKDRPEKGLFVIQANRQSSGRGRRGASFFSDTAGGLWVSIISPLSDINSHFVHNRALSMAIYDSVYRICPHAPLKIKWPNDIYWSDKKICGILLQNHSLYSDLLITGFGLNVNIKYEEFPSDLQSIATSILIETGHTASLNQLLHNIIEFYHFNLFSDQVEIHRRYQQRLYKKGCKIEIGDIRGIFQSVQMDGRLQIQQDNSSVYINSGTPIFLN